MPLLDTLEAWFTRKPKRRPLNPSDKTLPAWLHTPPPDRDLLASDYYSLSLYLRCALRPVVLISLVYSILWIGGMICLGIFAWHLYPALFHAGQWQPRVWHKVWQVLWPRLVSHGFIFIPFVPLAWALFGLIMYLPLVYFWNRRAHRLQNSEEVAPVQEVAEVAAPDTSIWPPPPRLNV